MYYIYMFTFKNVINIIIESLVHILSIYTYIILYIICIRENEMYTEIKIKLTTRNTETRLQL